MQNAVNPSDSLRDEQGRPMTAWIIKTVFRGCRYKTFAEPMVDHLRPYISDKVFRQRLQQVNSAAGKRIPIVIFHFVLIAALLVLVPLIVKGILVIDPQSIWFCLGVIFFPVPIIVPIVWRESKYGAEMRKLIEQFNEEDKDKLAWNHRGFTLNKNVYYAVLISKLVPESELPPMQAEPILHSMIVMDSPYSDTARLLHN
jgi:hypothetical protein